MQDKFIESNMLYLSKNNIRKYQITMSSLREFIKLRSRTQELFLDMLEKVGSQCDISALLVTGTYKDFGFKDCSNFNKYKNELIAADYISQADNGYYVNPSFVIYCTKPQRKYFFDLFGIIKIYRMPFNKKF